MGCKKHCLDKRAASRSPLGGKKGRSKSGEISTDAETMASLQKHSQETCTMPDQGSQPGTKPSQPSIVQRGSLEVFKAYGKSLHCF